MKKSILVFVVAFVFAMSALSVGAFAKSNRVMGKHVMAGTITKINHKTGWLLLKTGLGVLRLHYPPMTLKHVKKGEKMLAHLGFEIEK